MTLSKRAGVFFICFILATAFVAQAETIEYQLWEESNDSFQKVCGGGIFCQGFTSITPEYIWWHETATTTFNKVEHQLFTGGNGGTDNTLTGDLRLLIYYSDNNHNTLGSLATSSWRSLSDTDYFGTPGYCDVYVSGFSSKKCIFPFYFDDEVELAGNGYYLFKFEGDNIDAQSSTFPDFVQFLASCTTGFGGMVQSCKEATDKRASMSLISGAVPYIDVTSDITTNTTFLSGQIYKVSGVITVDPGVTLTVQPGVRVKFDTATTSGLIVEGTLNSIGSAGIEDLFSTTSSRVVFTSLKDDIGGDTNRDGATTTPSGSDWTGITVSSGGSATLNYTLVRYGGSASGSSAMVYNNGGTLNISSSTIAYGSNYGIRNSSGTASVVASDIAFNTHGLYVSGGTASIGATSTIHDNSTFGVYSTGTSVDAEGNYWGGGNSGPYNPSSNPSGLGNAVSDSVDFNPWVGTSTLHYVETIYGCPSSTCASVRNNTLLLDASTTPYMVELNFATSTWNELGSVNIALATSTANVAIYASSSPDVVWAGFWVGGEQPDSPDPLVLNTYFLDRMNSEKRKSTIIHELGHALGLDHSFTGNIMHYSVTSQTSFGSQDIDDYNYLW